MQVRPYHVPGIKPLLATHDARNLIYALFPGPTGVYFLNCHVVKNTLIYGCCEKYKPGLIKKPKTRVPITPKRATYIDVFLKEGGIQ